MAGLQRDNLRGKRCSSKQASAAQLLPCCWSSSRNGSHQAGKLFGMFEVWTHLRNDTNMSVSYLETRGTGPFPLAKQTHRTGSQPCTRTATIVVRQFQLFSWSWDWLGSVWN